MKTALTAVKLGEITSTVDYGHTASSTSAAVGPKFLRITDIQDDGVNWESVPFCECSLAEEASSKLQAGDIVFARTGATTGKSFLIRDCPERAVFASYLIRVRSKPDVCPNYLAHFFKTPEYWSQITMNARGAAQLGVNATVLKSLSIPLLPIAEQKRIAAILDKAEELRGLRRKALGELDAIVQSIFLEMFGDPATNSKKWKTGLLRTICDEINDCPHSTPVWTENGVICLRTSNLTRGSWNWNDTRFVSVETYHERSKRGYIKAGDIILSREGTVGVAAIATSEMKICMGQRLVQVRPLASVLTSEFTLQHLLYVLAPARISMLMVGSTSQHLNVKELKDLKIPLPPFSLQREFARRVEAIEQLKTIHRESLAHLDTLFASLQHRAFRGEL